MSQLELRHLHRDVQTALELAIVSLSPSGLLDRLAAAAGLLGAIAELPEGSAPARALIPQTEKAARSALTSWHAWEQEHLPKATA